MDPHTESITQKISSHQSEWLKMFAKGRPTFEHKYVPMISRSHMYCNFTSVCALGKQFLLGTQGCVLKRLSLNFIVHSLYSIFKEKEQSYTAFGTHPQMIASILFRAYDHLMSIV